jgi:hypothetical protein
MMRLSHGLDNHFLEAQMTAATAGSAKHDRIISVLIAAARTVFCSLKENLVYGARGSGTESAAGRSTAASTVPHKAGSPLLIMRLPRF